MDKFWIPGLSTALTLSMAALWPPQDEPTRETTVVGKKIEAREAGPEDGLRDLYTRLRRLRAERLAERPKALSDDAAKLYRQALKAQEAKEFDKARALTQAANELTRALELSVAAPSSEPNDPDLPPPPGVKTSVRVYAVPLQVQGRLAEMPPPLPAEGSGDGRVVLEKRIQLREPSVKGALSVRKLGDGEQTVIVGGDRVRMVKPSGDEQKRELIIEKIDERDGQVRVQIKGVEDAQKELDAARAQAEKARLDVAEVHNKLAQGIHERLQLKRVEGKVEMEVPPQALEELKRAEAKVMLHQSLAGQPIEVKVLPKLDMKYRVLEQAKAGGAGREASLKELKQAYATILDARKAKEAEAKTYLDAARDLYNAARREAEAGNFDRAAELARAAEALTLVPKHLKSLKTFEGKPVKVETKVHVIRPDGGEGEPRIVIEGHAKGEKKGGEENGSPKIQFFHGDIKDGKPQIRIETRGAEKGEQVEVRGFALKLDDAKDGAAKAKVEAKEGHKIELKLGDSAKPAEASPHEAPAAGLGVQMNFEEGKGNIVDLIAGSPAARDGRIKKGDAIVGIVSENGSTIGFGDKSMEESVKLLRGAAGTKVKVIVLPAGSQDLKVYEIERQKLELPKPAEAKPAGPSGGEGASLPPMLD